ncbi:MAG TPA: LysE family transporter [Methanosarcina sp.]|nr:LysE family transporter [Methanosarcina sp.]
MIELTKALILGFTVGISAAIVPGPMTFAAIGASFKNGWRAGPPIFIGHALTELAIFIIVLIGAASFLGKTTISYLSITGGLVMLFLGLMMIKKAKDTSVMGISTDNMNFSSNQMPAQITASKLNPFSGQVFTGIITSALNPFFVVWWLTAGSSIVLQEYIISLAAVIAFILGHWIADLGFLITLSFSFSRGKEMISQRTHQIMVYLCGGFMTVFGLWFMLNNTSIGAMI